MRSLIWVFSIYSLGGCIQSDSVSTGEVSVNLVGQTASGVIHRLRDATINVDGPGSHKVWNTEDDLTRTSLSANVVEGSYTASLQPGWRIERIDGSSTTTVPATLTSSNPALFDVLDGERTIVPLNFIVAGENVDMAQGYSIVLGVQEAVCGNFINEPGEECDDGNRFNFDFCSRACENVNEPAELEPNEDGTPTPGGDALLGNDFSRAAADVHGPISETFPFQRFIRAALSPSGDEDVYAIQTTPFSGFTLVQVATAPTSGGGLCDASTDTVLVLRDESGAVLAVNDDDPNFPTKCSQLSFNLPPGGKAYLQVLAFGDQQITPYFLSVEFF